MTIFLCKRTMRLLKKCMERKLLVILATSLLSVILLIEVIAYRWNTFYWHQLSCKTSLCTRILLVADPQLIGLQNEIYHQLTPISILDSDRYLFKTYSYAFDFSKPDIVIFLGDLLDEGSSATDAEFNSYLRRLFNIFLSGPSSNVKHIWLPGDNDIGGEGDDLITEKKIKRFQRAFSQPDIIPFKNIHFYKINGLLKTIPVFSDRKDFFNNKNITVGLSHIPLLFTPSVFVDKVISKLQPHLLLTAHTHASMIITLDALVRNDRQIIPVMSSNNRIYEYKLGSTDIYEIQIPTCSYRMGTAKIGFGFAIIDGSDLYYTVLWSPSRFHQLLFYLVFMVTVIIILLRNTLPHNRHSYSLLREV